MNNDPTPLQKRIRRALSIPAEWARRRDGETTMEQNERWQKRQDEQISALIATEVQAAAEHRIARLEAQTDIRGRAVVIYRERAREAEARVKAVRAIHRDLYESMSGVPYCDECDRAWPCPTIRALDGDA